MSVARTVSGLFQYASGVNGAGNLTLNGTSQINTGGFVSGSPAYGASSLLKYNTGTTYGRNGEWLPGATSGAGYPANVQLSNNTTLDLANSSTTQPFQMAGSLTIDSGSRMQLAGATPLTAPLVVLGNVNNNGTLTLSTALGGDINVGGNWTRAAAATFTPNGRAAIFSGSGNQLVTVNGGGTETFNFLVVNKSAGSLLPNNIAGSLTDLTVNATTGDALQLFNAGGIGLSGRTLTMSGNGGSLLASGAGSHTINGPGNFNFTGAKTVTSASGGTLTFATNGGINVNLSAGVNFGVALTSIQGTLSIKPGGFVNTNAPTYITGSTLEYDNGSTYDAAAEFPANGVQNVTLASTTQLNLNGDKSIAGTFNAGAGNIGSTAATPFSLTAGNITAATGTLNLNHVTTSTAFNVNGAANVNVAGNWNVAGFGAGACTVNFNGSGAQTIQTASAFNNLTASNDLTLGASPSVGGTLALGTRKITTGTFTLSLGNAATATRTSGYVLGTLQKSFNAPGSFTFDVGTANGYTPVDANSTTGTGSLSVGATQAKHSNIAGANALSRFWTLSGSGVNTNLTFHYLAGDVNATAPATEADYKILKFNGGAFTSFTPTALDTTNHTATLNGVNSFSDWTLATDASTFGALQFSASNYNDAETDSGTHTTTINVSRAGGGTSGAVSVHYATSAGTAAAGTDYDETSGDLNWANGDATYKTFNITVHGDTTFEPDETVNLTLSSPTGGAVLGTPSTATLTIQNDDGTPPPPVVYVDDDWAAVPNGTDPDGAGPATEMGFDAFATVQGGVTGVAPGGTVNVASGTYPEQVVVGKSLHLVGAGAATTTISTPPSLSPGVGGNLVLVQIENGAQVVASGIAVAGPRVFNGCSANIFYGVFVVGGANFDLSNSEVRDIRLSDPSLFGCQDGIAVRAGSQALGQSATLSLTNVNLHGYQKSAVIIDGTGTNGTVTNSTITGTGTPANIAANAVQISRNATATVQGSTITGNLCNNAACGPDPFTQSFSAGVLVFSTSNLVEIKNNIISNNDTGLYNNGGNTSVHDNTFDGNRYQSLFLDEGTATVGDNSLKGASSVGVSAISFEGNGGNSVGTLTHNTITGAQTGLQLLDDTSGSDGFVPQLTAHFNRIVATTTAIDNPQNEPADLENNWWGCNAGPGQTGCGAVTGTGADFNPWFVLAASATPNVIVPGGTSNVVADMTHNSDGLVPAGTLPDLPVAFAATHGTMSPTDSTVTSGQASSTFNSTDASSAVVSTTVDNQTVETPITVNAPSFSIDDVSHNEGDSGTTSYVFTVTKTGATNLVASVDFSTADDSATVAGGDYQQNSGTLTFAAGESAKQLTVLVNGDAAFEPNEQFFVNLSNASGATVADAQGVGTILNDDGTPSFSINDVTHNEGNAGTTAYVFNVNKTGTTAQAASVDFATQDGTATVADNDYQPNSGTLNFAAGETTKQVTVLANGDTSPESNETFTVHLSNASGASIGDADGLGTIKDDDTPSTVNTIVVLPTALDGWQQQHAHCSGGTSTGSQSFVSGPPSPPLGTGSIRFQIGPDGDSFETLRQTGYDGTHLSDLTALSYSTYVTQPGSGDQAAYIILNIDFDGDNQLEDQLFFEPVYQNGTYTTIFPGDTVPNQCGVNPACVTTGQWQTWNALGGGWWSGNESAGGPPLITLARYVEEHPTARIINTDTGAGGIRIATGCGGAAWANFDGNADAFQIGVDNATTRYDFEAALPTADIGDAAVPEGNSGTTPATFNITLSGVSSVPVTVNYSTADGTATVADADYQSVNDSVTFAAGETSKPVSIPVNGDTKFETDETFFVNLTGASGATVGDGQGQGTIQNDDDAPSFSINDVSQAEGDSSTTTFTFTVTKTGATALSASVDYSTADGTATVADGDYVAVPPTTLTFAPNETAKQVFVTVNGDTRPEVDETFFVMLGNPNTATIADNTGMGTIRNDDESVSVGQLIISEFRLRGPGNNTAAPVQGGPASRTTAGDEQNAPLPPATGDSNTSPLPPRQVADTSPEANDEFVELYNNTDSPLLVTTTDSSTGWALSASDGIVRFVVPNGTVIPARGHFLGVNSLGYSLDGYPSGNDGAAATNATGDPVLLGNGTPAGGYTLDIPDNAGIAVFRTATPANFGAGTRLDSVGSTDEADALYKEGAGYPALTPTDISGNLEHTFYRSLCSFVGGVGCTTPGVPKDTGNNAADFLFVDTQGTLTAAGQRLGAPAPENLSAHVQRNSTVSVLPLDRSRSTSVSPNRVRDFNPDPIHNSQSGTLSIRRRVTNNTGLPVTALRFRIVEVTTFPAPAGTADLRARTSGSVSVTNVADPDTCASANAPSTPCDITVGGTTLDVPPAQPNGGGFNSSMSTGAVTLTAPLAPGASVNVQFLLGLQQGGNFRFLINVEAVTGAATPTERPRDRN
jgi:hypothetical protein